MKLDKDLVREILLQVEASPDPMGIVDLTISDHEQDEIAYHVQILDEAGLIEALDLTTMSDYDWRPRRLTYDGHEFLDTIRDAAAWRFTKRLRRTPGLPASRPCLKSARATPDRSSSSTGCISHDRVVRSLANSLSFPALHLYTAARS